MLLGQFEYGLAAFEIVTGHNAGIIKLVQYAVNRSQANFFAHIYQFFVQIFRTDVMAFRILQYFQDFESRKRDF
ncbi:hypothetical protein D3C72_1616860 [compost metagenome]